ncbi:MAG: pilus assembly protein TadG-related protein [Solirubrobacterales bacterium]
MKFNHLKDENGSVLVMVALAIVVIMGFSAFAIDFGMGYYQRQKLQSAIDAASVAAAKDIPKGISVAQATANSYIELNGFDPDTDLEEPPYVDTSTNTVTIKGHKEVNYLFGKIIEKAAGEEYMTVKPKAKAQLQNPGGEAFDYAVFAGGGTASFNGTNHTFHGDVYGRDGVSLGNKANVSGKVVCTSSGSVSEGNNSTIDGPVIEDSPEIPMPDFSEVIKAQAIKLGTYCTNQIQFDAIVNGKTVEGPIYVEGGITINGRIKGKGIICSSGKIDAQNANQANTDSICFYSKNGDITFNGGTGNIYGILYAPNGTVRDNGGPNGSLHGRIIAKNVDCNGAKFSVYSNPNDLNGANTMPTVKLIDEN